LKISLSLQQDFQSPELELKRAQLKKIIETTLRHVDYKEDCEIGVACVDLAESQQLNLQYREKDKPTNVLSFPSDIPEEVLPMLDALRIRTEKNCPKPFCTSISTWCFTFAWL